MNILKVSTNGVLTEHELDKSNTLDHLYKLIGCDYIEIVKPIMLYTKFGCIPEPDVKNPGKAVCMIIDEEGIVVGKRPNLFATGLYSYNAIVGDVVFVGLEYTRDGIDICGIEPDEYNRLLREFKKYLEDL